MNAHPKPGSRIELEGCYNLRDIGGYATTDGHMTAWGKVFRSDSVHRLPEISQQQLIARPIRTIIDLRHPFEVRKSPSVFVQSTDVTYVSTPLIEDSNEVWEPADLEELNKLLLDESQPQLRHVFSVLAVAQYPVLLHCRVGKDRTGLVIALLLGLLQVPDETIIEDYALSALYLEPLFARWRQRASSLDAASVVQMETMLESKPETMRNVLTYLKKRYGSVPHYLLHIGVTEQQIAFLRQTLIA